MTTGSNSSPTDLLQEGLALHRRGAVGEAASRYAEVLRADPGSADAHYYLGMIACQQGRFVEGAERARQALAGAADHAGAHVLLGRALAALGRSDEALTSFERALALAPDFAKAHGHRADLLGSLGRHAEAIESYDRALALAPDAVEDWFNRGAALIEAGRYEDAVASFDRALALRPDAAAAELLRGPRFLSKLRICDWTGYDDEVVGLSQTIREGALLSVPTAALLLPVTPAEQRQCAERFVRDEPAYPPLWRGERYAHDRIRVAYLSADFREHPTSYLAAGLFEQHDRSRFEITALSLVASDQSPIRQRVERAFERFVDVSAQSDRQIAELMRGREIDIAVDLMGFSKHNRHSVLAHRPAPIILNYLGYAGTTGARSVDYVLADATVIPVQHEAFYSEHVVRLPETYQINDDTRPIAPNALSRRECGLPDDAFVFCCFNNPQKLTPRVFDVWMNLLRKTDGSALWLIDGGPTVATNLRAAAKQRGVPAERLIFAPRVSLPDHLARQRQADLFLDTLPYNAHTTASDALWGGLPVVTCLGATFAGRVAASLLKAIGLDELIATSMEEYEALALRLAREPEYLGSIKARLARNRRTSPLFDTKRTTRLIESAYATMVDIQRRGEGPRSFAVKAD